MTQNAAIHITCARCEREAEHTWRGLHFCWEHMLAIKARARMLVAA